MQHRKLRKFKSSLKTEMFSPNTETEIPMEKETEMQRESERERNQSTVPGGRKFHFFVA